MNFKEFTESMNLNYDNLPKTIVDIDNVLDSTHDIVSVLYGAGERELYQLSLERCLLSELKELCEDSILRDYYIEQDIVQTAFDNVMNQHYDLFGQAEIEALFVCVRDWKGAYTVHNLIDKINRIDEKRKKENAESNS